MLGPMKFYNKTKNIDQNSKILTQINENNNEATFFMELHYNQLVLMIFRNMIGKRLWNFGGITEPAAAFLKVS
jgi:hypothetical protein